MIPEYKLHIDFVISSAKFFLIQGKSYMENVSYMCHIYWPNTCENNNTWENM